MPVSSDQWSLGSRVLAEVSRVLAEVTRGHTRDTLSPAAPHSRFSTTYIMCNMCILSGSAPLVT